MIKEKFGAGLMSNDFVRYASACRKSAGARQTRRTALPCRSSLNKDHDPLEAKTTGFNFVRSYFLAMSYGQVVNSNVSTSDRINVSL